MKLIIQRLNLLIVFAVVLVSALLEVRTGRIYDAVTLPSIVTGLVLGLPCGNFRGRLVSLSVVFVAAVAMAMAAGAIFKTESIGGGALKLIFAVSAFFSLRQSALFFGYFLLLLVLSRVLLFYFPALPVWDKHSLIYLGDGLVRTGAFILAALVLMVVLTPRRRGQPPLGTNSVTF